MEAQELTLGDVFLIGSKRLLCLASIARGDSCTLIAVAFPHVRLDTVFEINTVSSARFEIDSRRANLHTFRVDA